jgi:hypothetical protein
MSVFGDGGAAKRALRSQMGLAHYVKSGLPEQLAHLKIIVVADPDLLGARVMITDPATGHAWRSVLERAFVADGRVLPCKIPDALLAEIALTASHAPPADEFSPGLHTQLP